MPDDEKKPYAPEPLYQRMREVINNIPQQRQKQDALNDQLAALQVVANRLGLYDAADFLRNTLERK